MKKFELDICDRTGVSTIGVKETLDIRKRKGGLVIKMAVGASSALQPLITLSKRENIVKPLTDEMLENKTAGVLLYSLKNLGYIIDIKYSIYEDGTDKFVYSVYMPINHDTEENVLCCEKVININIKEAVIEYYKNVCRKRLQYKYRGLLNQ